MGAPRLWRSAETAPSHHNYPCQSHARCGMQPLAAASLKDSFLLGDLLFQRKVPRRSSACGRSAGLRTVTGLRPILANEQLDFFTTCSLLKGRVAIVRLRRRIRSAEKQQPCNLGRLRSVQRREAARPLNLEISLRSNQRLYD